MKFELQPFFRFNHIGGRWGFPDYCSLSFSVHLWGLQWFPHLRYINSAGQMIVTFHFICFVFMFEITDSGLQKDRKIEEVIEHHDKGE